MAFAPAGRSSGVNVARSHHAEMPTIKGRDLGDVLVVGREMKFGTELGPPLAFWLAEIALQAAAGHMFGVYLLSQLCIVATYWAVFELGRATIGERHAVLAVLLMVGISVFTVGSPRQVAPGMRVLTSAPSSLCV